MAESDTHAEGLEANKPRIDRLFESSRFEDDLLAIAYEVLVPISKAACARYTPERPEVIAPAIPNCLGPFVPRDR